ncbi:MAG TPA: response regulator [Kofleriaceae bacterium]|nr:response regulator [Kofleriaceae bacterium]
MPPLPPSLPNRVIFVPARGGGPGHAAMLRELIERLGGLGVDTLVLPELDEAVRTAADDPSAVVVLDVDDANHGHAVPAMIAQRVEAVVHQVLDATPVAIATRPTPVTILTCHRAGAIAFVDLAQDSIDAAIQILARAARERARATTQRRALDQLHSIVEELLRDLVKTERRSIDLEKRLADLGGFTGAPADIDRQRAPVVMVVDDDRQVVDFLVHQLEHAGLTTFAFVTGEEATAHADRMAQRGEALDLVMVDLRLPGIDGLEVVRRLRKDRPALAAFLVTAWADPTLSARAADLGVVGLASKPFEDPQRLIGQIHEEAEAAMARTREHGYLQRIKARHDRVLYQYRLLLAGLQ